MMNVDNRNIFIKKSSKEIREDYLKRIRVFDRSSYSRCSMNIRAILNQIQNIRKEHLSLKDFVSKDTQNWKKFFQTTRNSLEKGKDLLDPFPV